MPQDTNIKPQEFNREELLIKAKEQGVAFSKGIHSVPFVTINNIQNTDIKVSVLYIKSSQHLIINVDAKKEG